MMMNDGDDDRIPTTKKKLKLEEESRKEDFLGIHQVLDPSLTRFTLPTQPIATVRTRSPKLIRPLMARIKQISPLPDSLQFAKRVKPSYESSASSSEDSSSESKLLILGLLSEEINWTEIIDDLQRIDPDCQLYNNHSLKIVTSPPQTRQQFDYAKQFWPVSFRPEERTERALAGEVFTDAETERIYELMRRLMTPEAAAKSSDSAAKIPQQNRAMLVEPDAGKMDILGMKNGMSREDPYRPLGHAVMELIGTYSHTRPPPAYLFNGLDCFLLCEPCPMCAMALLHSRVSRVFYLAAAKTTGGAASSGALGSRWHLHTHPRLNHKFDVFRIVPS